mgnify:CR=1 FL=1
MSDVSPVCKRLKQARILNGLSQKQLGIYAGIDEFSASARMNQYETGKHVPDFLTLKRIAMVLGYPVAYFYAEDDLAIGSVRFAEPEHICTSRFKYIISRR